MTEAELKNMDDMFINHMRPAVDILKIMVEQKDVLAIDNFVAVLKRNRNSFFSKNTSDAEFERQVPYYYMSHLFQRFVENAQRSVLENNKQKQEPANKSSERPYLKLVR